MRIVVPALCLAVGAAGCVATGEATTARSEASHTPESSALVPLDPAAPAAPAVEPAGSDCAPTVDQLPPTPYVRPGDPRLQSQHLVVVRKSARRIARYHHGHLVGDHCYRIGLGQGPEAAVGPKRQRGDRKTPQGWYRTSDKPWSQFYAAIAVHYPNGADAVAGKAAGHLDAQQVAAIDAAIDGDLKPPQDTPLGGEILIHGGGGSSDWTLGCIAMDDRDLDAMRASLPSEQRFDLLILP